MKLEIVGKFYDTHSLSIVNRGIIKSLYELQDDNFEFCITPLDSFQPECKIDKNDLKIIKELEKKDIKEPDIQLRHSYPPIWRYPVCKKTLVIFIQPWEFNKLPSEWQYKWEQFADAVICPSNWNSNVYLEAGANPEEIFTIPNGYNPKLFNKEPQESPVKFDRDKFTFVYVGNGQYRKGVDILLNVWSQCFVKADKVRLVIKDSPSIYGTNNILEETIKMQYKKGAAEIIYIDDLYTDKEMAGLYKNSDVIVHPFRGEGFGMHIQEAIACGCYPVVSEGGGPSDFTDNDSGSMIQTKRLFINYLDNNVFATKPGDSLTLMNQHGWIMEPVPESLGTLLKNIYTYRNFDELKEKTKLAKLTTWSKAAKIYKDVLMEIKRRRGDIPKRYGNTDYRNR